MTRYVVISLVGGILFAVLDGLMNANPVAQRLYGVYKPIAKTSVNIAGGVTVDLTYGFILAAVFLLLYSSLPGAGGIGKGLSFGVLVWFFRVVMSVASTWVMFTIPARTLLYTLIAGLGEMLVLGMLYGVSLRPAT